MPHFSPENPCRALPAATSLTDVLLRHTLSFLHSGSLVKYFTPRAKFLVLPVGGNGVAKSSLGHTWLQGADAWTLCGLPCRWVTRLCLGRSFPLKGGWLQPFELQGKLPAQYQLQERAWLNVRYGGMRDSWHLWGRRINYTFWYIFKGAVFQFISMKYKCLWLFLYIEKQKSKRLLNIAEWDRQGEWQKTCVADSGVEHKGRQNFLGYCGF